MNVDRQILWSSQRAETAEEHQRDSELTFYPEQYHSNVTWDEHEKFQVELTVNVRYDIIVEKSW